jgi:hypothetical protein
MKRCDKELPALEIPESVWEGLDGTAQVNAIVKYVITEWSGPYHRCALRHNDLVTHNEGPP